MSVTNSNTNFDIVILHEDQRLAVNPILQRAGVVPSRGMIDAIAGMSRNDYCAVLTEDRKNDGVITQRAGDCQGRAFRDDEADVFSRGNRAGSGPVQRPPRARPSIFNDDEEFGRLTTHDEMLLKILYDPRMRPGMSAVAAETMAVVIANELVGGES